MNVLLPAAPSGAKSVPGAGEGSHGRHEKLDGNFAAALAETAGESGDEAVHDETGISKPDDAGAHARAGRRVGARHGREAHERLNGEAPMAKADFANELVPEWREGVCTVKDFALRRQDDRIVYRCASCLVELKSINLDFV